MTNDATIKPANAAPFERLVPNPKARLREQLHEVCRFKHFSPRTEESYWGWMRRFLIFHKQGEQWRHPKELGGKEVTEFLTHLAVDKELGASSQNQGMNAPHHLISTRLQPGEGGWREGKPFQRFVPDGWRCGLQEAVETAGLRAFASTPG